MGDLLPNKRKIYFMEFHVTATYGTQLGSVPSWDGGMAILMPGHHYGKSLIDL